MLPVEVPVTTQIKNAVLAPRLVAVTDGEPSFYELTGDQYVLGRSPKSEIFLADNQASRRHAMIERSGRGFQVRDLGSHNGIFLNGRKVEQARLQSWDAVIIGKSLILFVDPASFAAEAMGEAGDPPEENGPLAEAVRSAVDSRDGFTQNMVLRFREKSLPPQDAGLEGLEFAHSRLGPDHGGDFLGIESVTDRALLFLGDVERRKAAHSFIAGVSVHHTLRGILRSSPERSGRLLNRALDTLDPETVPPESLNLLIASTTTCGDLEATSLGRVSALVYRSRGERIEVLRNADLIGPEERLSFSIELDPKDIAVFITRGLMNARSIIGEGFTVNRLKRVIVNAKPRSADELLERLTQTLTSHSSTALSDDVSFVLVGRS